MDASSSRVRTVLRSVFAEQVVEDPLAPPNFALVETSAGLPGVHPMYRIYERCKHVFTARSLGRALAVLRGYLEQHLPGVPRTPAMLELASLALIGPEGALLAPRSLRHIAPELELRLRRNAVRVVEGASVFVDTERRVLVVPPWRLAFSTDSVATADGHREKLDPTPPTTVPIVAWLVPDVGADVTNVRVGRSLRARAVAQGIGITHRVHDPSATLGALVDLVSGLEVHGFSATGEVPKIARTTLGGTPRAVPPNAASCIDEARA